MLISKGGLIVFSQISSMLDYKTLMYILAYTDENGECNLTQDEIAKGTNVYRQSVNRSIKSLQELNILSIEKRGFKRTYHINPDFCITSAGYKYLNEKFVKYKNNNGGDLNVKGSRK